MFLLLSPSQRSLTVSVGTLVMVRTFALFSWFPFYLPVALERRTDVSHCCFRIFGRFVQLSGWSLLISTINIDFFINICDFTPLTSEAYTALSAAISQKTWRRTSQCFTGKKMRNFKSMLLETFSWLWLTFSIEWGWHKYFSSVCYSPSFVRVLMRQALMLEQSDCPAIETNLRFFYYYHRLEETQSSSIWKLISIWTQLW